MGKCEYSEGAVDRNGLLGVFPRNDGKTRYNNKILFVCYTGDVSRIAASILRAKGVETFSLRGGFAGLGV